MERDERVRGLGQCAADLQRGRDASAHVRDDGVAGDA